MVAMAICLLITFHYVDMTMRLPEQDMSTTEIIEYYGYPAESIRVKTDDGYILEMHRIPFGKNKDPLQNNITKPIVFLQHGLLAASSDFVLNLPSNSLAFLLADQNFDVWLGNMRGNLYSRKHDSDPVFSKKFWSFTWDEMAKYDLEAMVDAVLDITNQKKLYYIGHSQGTMTLFGKLSDDMLFNAKIEKFFALAPVARVGHIKGLIHTIGTVLLPHISLIEKIFGSLEFLPSAWYIKLSSRIFCPSTFTNPLCTQILFLIGGPESNQMNFTRLPVYLSHSPAGTSTANIIHWGQMVASGKCQKYDYGSSEKNVLHYGQELPPEYDLTKIETDVYLYWSETDWLADSIDVHEGILSKIPPKYIKLSSKLTDFNHFDFIYGLRAKKEIYEPIINIINQNEYKKRNKIYVS
uniref:Lipase n=1 Tax=Rhabditophanes sp. KR3021 TaxID=114890 RepID=A0AC35TK84_9BILA